MTPEAPVLLAAGSVALELSVTGDSAGLGTLKWTSSNTSVATVDQTGLLRGVGIGSAMIAVALGGAESQTTVAVIVPAGTIRTRNETSCGVAVSGAAYCWGDNSHSQIGAGPIGTPQPTPVKVSGGSTFSSISIGTDHTCAMSSNGAYCWGVNTLGELGIGSSGNVMTVPTSVVSSSGFTSIDVNGFHDYGACPDILCSSQSCALTGDGQAWCWGATASPSGLFNSPQPGAGNLRFRSLSVGVGHACGITLDYAAYCWGNDGVNTLQSGVLNRIGGDKLFQAVSTTWRHTCVIDLAGNAYCWGSNASGQLGGDATETCSVRFAGTYPCSKSLVLVQGGHKFQSISVGTASPVFDEFLPKSMTCGITVNQQLYCWGGYRLGAPASSIPELLASDRKFLSVSAGLTAICATAIDGTGYCYGFNDVGQLGNGTRTNSATFVQVLLPAGERFR